MRPLLHCGPSLGPTQSGFADYGNERRAFQGFDDADQLRRPERAAELQVSWREVGDAERAGRSLKCRFQDVRARQVTLFAGLSSGWTDAEASPVLTVQEG